MRKIVRLPNSSDLLEHKWVGLASLNVWLHNECEDAV